MKLVLMVLAVVICCFGLIEASPSQRTKRSVAYGLCPPNQDCEEYAKELVKGQCSTYSISGDKFNIIGCGSVQCYGPNGEIEPKSDLNKPHPDCCPRCT